MKKFCFILAVLFVVLSIAACFPTSDKPSTDPSETSNSSGVSDTVSDTAPSKDPSDVDENSQTPEVSEEVSTEPELSQMSALELITYADKLWETVDSAKSNMHTDMFMTIDGQEASYTSTTSFKESGLTTDTPEASITHTDPDTGETATLYFKDGKGYYASTAGRYSFDCDADTFYEFASHFMGTGDHFASPVTGEFEEDDGAAYNTIYEMCTVSRTDDDGFKLYYNGTITDPELLELFGLEEGQYNEEDGIKLEYTAILDKEGFMYSEVMKTEYVLITDAYTASVSSVITYEVSDINKPVLITVPESGFTDIGDIRAMYFRYCLDQLNLLPDYSTKVTHNYVLTAPGVNDTVNVTRDFIVNKGDDIKFSYDMTAALRGTKVSIRHYYEDGTFYVKQGNELQSQEVGALDDATVLSVWVTIYPEMSLGKNYVFTDNGDGTGTLSFVYTDEAVASLADFMFASIYGDVSGFFTNAQSITVNKATASITADLETGVLISHKYDIDAKFVVEGENVTYKETTEITASTEKKAVPDRAQFFGQSSL